MPTKERWKTTIVSSGVSLLFPFCDKILVQVSFISEFSGGRVLGRSYASRLKSNVNATSLSTSSLTSTTATPASILRNQRLPTMENQHQQFQNLLHQPPSSTATLLSTTGCPPAFHENSLTTRSTSSNPMMLTPHVNNSSTNPRIPSMATANTATSPSPVVCMDGTDGDNLS